jgi:hypothetical protein
VRFDVGAFSDSGSAAAGKRRDFCRLCSDIASPTSS